jgi:hypothetical protein
MNHVDQQVATQKLYYQLDPLSRRSLLAYPPSQEMAETETNAFILSSARSALARERGIEMRTLGGGEGGVIDLSRIESEGQAINFGQAIEFWTSRAGGKYVG